MWNGSLTTTILFAVVPDVHVAESSGDGLAVADGHRAT
jgi:hypothetical protein